MTPMQEYEKKLLSFVIIGLIAIVVIFALAQSAKSDPVRFSHAEPTTVEFYLVKDDLKVEVYALAGPGPYEVNFPLTWPTTTTVVAVGFTGQESLPSNTVFRVPEANTCPSVDFNHDHIIGGPDFAGMVSHLAVSKFATLVRCWGKY